MKASPGSDGKSGGWRQLLRLQVPREWLIVRLEAATLAYAGLPALLWVAGWLRWPVACVLGLALLAALFLAFRQTRRFFRERRGTYEHEPSSLPAWSLAGAVLVAIVWGMYSGAGGFTFSNLDWVKHFAVLRDLIEYPWPVVYQLEDRTVPLVYYVAYYLPSAAIGTQFGWWWACFALMAWTCLGAVLACLWFALLVGSRPFLSGVYFILANGLDFIGHRLVGGTELPGGTEHLDWWVGWNTLDFPGHYSQLVWAPQHSLVAWSVTGLLAVQLSAGRGLSHAGLLAGLAALWSPFTALGMIPLGVFAAVRERGRGLFSVPNLLAVPLVIVFAAYLLSRSEPSPHGWYFQHAREEWLRFVLAHLLEWGVFVLFAREVWRSRQPYLRGLFWTALVALSLIPFYRLGVFNDWCMRVTIPSMYLLWAGVGRSLLRPPFTVESRVLLLLCVFGAMGALPESARSWKTRGQPEPMESHDHVPYIELDVARQYFGRDTSFFFRHLTRPYTVVTPEKR